jgi:hypothetical protein
MYKASVTKSLNFFIVKPTRCTNFSNLFWNETLRVSNSSSAHHQELFTVHSAMVYVVQFCRQLSSRIKMELQFHPEEPSELSETCRVSFQNKFEKLVHIFGFIIRKFVTMYGHMNGKKKPELSNYPAELD